MQTTKRTPSIYLFLFLGVSNSFSAKAQKDTIDFTIQLSPADLKEDLEILQNHLEQLHIGLYNYNSKVKIDAAFEEIAKKLVKKDLF